MDSELIDSEDYWDEQKGREIIDASGAKFGGKYILINTVLFLAAVSLIYMGLTGENPVNIFEGETTTIARQAVETTPFNTPESTSSTTSTTTTSTSIPKTTTSSTITLTSSSSTTTILIDSCYNLCMKLFNETGDCVDEPSNCGGNKNHAARGGDKYCKSESQKYDTCCCIG
ncbi:MAG: hypothetical protein ABH851_09300 [Methanobacteriota archaeon]